MGKFSVEDIQNASAYDLIHGILKQQKDFLYKGMQCTYVCIKGDFILLNDSRDNEQKVSLSEAGLVLLLSRQQPSAATSQPYCSPKEHPSKILPIGHSQTRGIQSIPESAQAQPSHAKVAGFDVNQQPDPRA